MRRLHATNNGKPAQPGREASFVSIDTMFPTEDIGVLSGDSKVDARTSHQYGPK
jgi:hypothetical protein